MARPTALALAALLLGCGAGSEPQELPEGSAPLHFHVADYAGNVVWTWDDGFTAATGFVDKPSAVVGGAELHVASMQTGGVSRWVDGAEQPLFQDRYLLEEPTALVSLDDGLLVLGNDTRSLLRIDADGDVLNHCFDDALRDAHDAALGPDGALWVASSWDGGLQRWDLATLAPIDVRGEGLDPVALDWLPSGEVVYADWSAGRVATLGGGWSVDVEGPWDLAVAGDSVLVLEKDRVVVFDAETADWVDEHPLPEGAFGVAIDAR